MEEHSIQRTVFQGGNMDNSKSDGTLVRAIERTESRLKRLASGEQPSAGLDRRGFVKGMVLALAVVPMISFLRACKGDSDAPPAGMAPVDPEKDPTAKAL